MVAVSLECTTTLNASLGVRSIPNADPELRSVTTQVEARLPIPWAGGGPSPRSPGCSRRGKKKSTWMAVSPAAAKALTEPGRSTGFIFCTRSQVALGPPNTALSPGSLAPIGKAVPTRPARALPSAPSSSGIITKSPLPGKLSQLKSVRLDGEKDLLAPPAFPPPELLDPLAKYILSGICKSAAGMAPILPSLLKAAWTLSRLTSAWTMAIIPLVHIGRDDLSAGLGVRFVVGRPHGYCTG